MITELFPDGFLVFVVGLDTTFVQQPASLTGVLAGNCADSVCAIGVPTGIFAGNCPDTVWVIRDTF